jgi:hypothetical protein
LSSHEGGPLTRAKAMARADTNLSGCIGLVAIRANEMDKLILMTIVAWQPQADGRLAEAWRLERETTVRVCLQMTTFAAHGGPAGAWTVKCGKIDDYNIQLTDAACSSFMRGLHAFFGRRC